MPRVISWKFPCTIISLFCKRKDQIFSNLLHFYQEFYFCVFHTNTGNIITFNKFDTTNIFLYSLKNKSPTLLQLYRRFVRFGTICTKRKREKHLWRSVTFSKVAGFSLKVIYAMVISIKPAFTQKWKKKRALFENCSKLPINTPEQLH